MSEYHGETPIRVQPEHKPKKKRSWKFALGLTVVFLLISATTVWGIVSFKLYLDTKAKLTSLESLNQQQQELTEAQIQEILDSVRQHILIQEDEEAVIATIVDAASLIAEQPFYENAVNGDHVIVLPASQKAILYSPSRDVVINVGPISLEENTAQATPVPEVIATPEPTPVPTPVPTVVSDPVEPTPEVTSE